MTIVDYQFLLFVCIPIGIGVIFTTVFVIQDLIEVIKDVRTKNLHHSDRSERT